MIPFSAAFALGAALAMGCPMAASGDDTDAATAAPAEEKKPVITKIGENEYQLGEIRFNRKTREIRIPAVVNLTAPTILEFALVNQQIGKLHESLLATMARPMELQVVLKLLKYVPSQRQIWPRYDEEGKPILPMKTDKLGGVRITVMPKLGDHKGEEVPIEHWIMNGAEKQPMAENAWVYTGSKVIDGNFLAELEGSFMAIYRTGSAMFNAFAKGSDSDEIWFPRMGHVPQVSTPVDVIIRPRAIAE